MPQLFLLLVMGGAFYALIMRPQQQRVRKHNDLVSSVAVGDEIVSAGGIVGKVTRVDERDVDFEIAPGVVVKLAKGAIAQKAPAATEPSGKTE
jgi:preprotein translocase subunit YajC